MQQKELMKKIEIQRRKELLQQSEIFCTECGAKLENFCFSSSADDAEAIKKNLAQCKKSGKFVGEFCAKLFISDGDPLDSLWEKEPKG
jgi:hypothetical protein